MPDLENLQRELGYRFHQPQHLLLALTHPSVAREAGVGMQHNQRLEFLGDAVLQLVLTRELFEKFAEVGEGPLTKARAQLVNRRTLAQQARRLDLGRHLVLSRGEEMTGGRERASALADGFEALIGAIFLDGGFDTAREFVLRQFREAFGELQVLPNLDNPKGELQELLQAEGTEAPRYELQATSGPDHDREFECAVFFRGEELARGKGKSKKLAESEAALVALESLRRQRAEGGGPPEG
ncbi:MAG: ribonuclease III [Verrucomicrobia bacterium]|nr:ribonuclease III [Verrucomicrobiota bacterium]